MKRSKVFYQNFGANGYKWSFWDEDLNAHCFTKQNSNGSFSSCYLWESDLDNIASGLFLLQNNYSRIRTTK